MRTFEQLIELRNTFASKTDTKIIVDRLAELNNNSNSLKLELGESYHNELRKLGYNLEDLGAVLTKIAGVRERSLAIINEQIKEYENKFDNDIYEHRMRLTQPEEVRAQRVFKSSNAACDSAVSSISQYINWQYPALEIGPNGNKWTKHLTGFEPLYLADTHNSFMSECISSFNQLNQQKIRPYIIRNRSLSMLPQNQFSFVFSWDFFKYVSLKGLQEYIPEIYKVLRPGGTFMFGYNNAELPPGAARADRYEMSYTPKSSVTSLLSGNNFNITRCIDFDSDTSWIEACKIGELSGIKRHATLGEIIFADH